MHILIKYCNSCHNDEFNLIKNIESFFLKKGCKVTLFNKISHFEEIYHDWYIQNLHNKNIIYEQDIINANFEEIYEKLK